MSSFKKLYTDVISSGFDTKKVQKATGNRDLIVYVKESYPYFLVTDNYYFVRLYFTKKAVDSFKSQFKNANIVDLKSKTIKVKDWDIEMSKSSSFTSYGGVEIKLIANDFQIVKQDLQLDRYPSNIYRDQGIKTMILNQLHASIVKSVPSASLPDISKFGKGSVSQGIVKAGSSGPSFAVGKTATVDMTTLFKQEKGAAAFAALSGTTSSKPKVTGGKTKKSKASVKKSGIASKIMKASVNAKKTTGKLSSGSMLTPGGASDGKMTTSGQSLKDFKKMMTWYTKAKANVAAKKTTSKKISKGSKK